jgi:hypothetical protein
LHAFGMTARVDRSDPIGAALLDPVRDYPDRFCVRFSNAPQPFEAPSTVSIEHPFQKPPDAIICPQEMARTESYSTCGLCWQTTRRIAFLQH